MSHKLSRRKRIHLSIRNKIKGSTERPRLSVFRSNTDLFAQIIDDNKAVTICSASSKAVTSKLTTKVDSAKNIGLLLAKAALEKGVSKVVFDRGGYLFHGRVKALAEGAREGGLQF